MSPAELGRVRLTRECRNGMYLENCRYVKFGWFGSLRISSRTAFDTLPDNIDSCKQSLDWKVGFEGGKLSSTGAVPVALVPLLRCSAIP